MLNNKNLPAYPLQLKVGERFEGMCSTDGMSQRTLIAAMCLQGLLANPNCMNPPKMMKGWEGAIAEDAIEAADALLTHLSNTSQ